jgi:hypothetical protein
VIVQLYWLLKCGWLCLLNIAGRKRYALIKYKWKKRIHTRLKSCGSVITGVIIHRRVRLKKFQMFCSYHVGWRLGGGSWLLTVYLRKRGESKDMICTCKVKIAWYVKEKKRNYIQKLRSCENVITGAINQRRVRLKALQRFCSNHAFHHGYHRGWLRGGELVTVYLRKQRGNTDIYTCNLSISLKFQQPHQYQQWILLMERRRTIELKRKRRFN